MTVSHSDRHSFLHRILARRCSAGYPRSVRIHRGIGIPLEHRKADPHRASRATGARNVRSPKLRHVRKYWCRCSHRRRSLRDTCNGPGNSRRPSSSAEYDMIIHIMKRCSLHIYHKCCILLSAHFDLKNHRILIFGILLYDKNCSLFHSKSKYDNLGIIRLSSLLSILGKI